MSSRERPVPFTCTCTLCDPGVPWPEVWQTGWPGASAVRPCAGSCCPPWGDAPLFWGLEGALGESCLGPLKLPHSRVTRTLLPASPALAGPATCALGPGIAAVWVWERVLPALSPVRVDVEQTGPLGPSGALALTVSSAGRSVEEALTQLSLSDVESAFYSPTLAGMQDPRRSRRLWVTACRWAAALGARGRCRARPRDSACVDAAVGVGRPAVLPQPGPCWADVGLLG